MQKKKDCTTAQSTEGRPIKKSKSAISSSCPYMNSQRIQEVSRLFLRIMIISSLHKFGNL